MTTKLMSIFQTCPPVYIHGCMSERAQIKATMTVTHKTPQFLQRPIFKIFHGFRFHFLLFQKFGHRKFCKLVSEIKYFAIENIKTLTMTVSFHTKCE